jgi:putative oxidoreductase
MHMTDAQRAMMRTYGTLVARIFLGLLFLVSGYGKFSGGVQGFSEHIPEMLPFPLLFAWVVVLLEIVGGAMLIVGYRVGLASGALVVFLVLTVLLVHNPLVDGAQLSKALNNFALMAGMLYVMAYGPGDGWRISK